MTFVYRKKAFEFHGVSSGDSIQSAIGRNRTFYEVDLLEYLFSLRAYLGRANSVAVDVGANIGNHAVFFRTFLTDHVICVEPNPSVLPVLEQNLRKNIHGFDIVPCALGASEGSGSLVLPADHADDAGMARIDRHDEAGTIGIRPLDAVLSEWSQRQSNDMVPVMIKIDVEGMELEVLKGAGDTIARYHPHLLLEAATDADYAALSDHLGGMGYQALARWARTPVYHFAWRPTPELMRAAQRAKWTGRILDLTVRRLRRWLIRLAPGAGNNRSSIHR
ncbi:MAG: FkbM family methyltransferase [Verrucomicrobia bacterium]|nr:FkbM family methyltransferase [Verrucomicrobiota bacterium]MDA1086431.1 FkbM family methyltransferase [Verrucomicrobiota bacterium]